MSNKTISMIRKESIESYAERNIDAYQNVSITKTAENFSSEDIRIVHRNNFQFICTKNPGGLPSEQHILLRTTYTVREQNSVKSLINVLDEVLRNSNIKNRDVNLICDTLVKRNNEQHNRLHIASIVLERKVTLTEIKRNNALYIHDEDILVCNPDIRSFMPHPFSDEGMIIKQKTEFMSKTKHHGLFLDIVDNEQKVNKRVIYLAKRPVEFYPRQDSMLKSGVYVTIGSTGIDGSTNLDSSYMTFEQAKEQIGLHDNEQDAVTNGDPVILLKNEEIRLKEELQRSNERVMKADEALRIAQKETDAAKAWRSDWADQRKVVRADTYEEKSHIRKDSTEIWKLASAICITGLAVYAAVVKGKSS